MFRKANNCLIEHEPIFIIGNPRSGTTLLRLMLSAHPNIYIALECGFLMHLYSKYKNYNGAESEIDEFCTNVINSRKFEFWGISKNELLNYILTKKPQNYSSLAACVYCCYGEKKYPGKNKWGDKNNYYLKYIAELHHLFPRAKFVHIIRDVRDVVCSYLDLKKAKNLKYAPNLPEEIPDASKEWVDNISLIRKQFNSLSAISFIELKYEDLILDPTKTLKRICNYLDEPYSDNMLEYYSSNGLDLEPVDFKPWKSTTFKTIDLSKVNRWKDVLSEQDVAIIENNASEIMKKYNYPLFFYLY